MKLPHWILRLYAGHLARRTRGAIANPRATQEALLMRILAMYRPTELGRMLKLAEIDSVASFKQRMPVTTYADYEALFLRVLETNEPDLVTAGKLGYIARTSGTMGTLKYNAFPPALIKAFKAFETRLTLHHMVRKDRYDLLDGRILVTAGSPALEKTAQGLQLAFATGIMVANTPELGRRIVLPGREIQVMTEWRQKVAATIAEAHPQDVRIMTGIPLFVVPLLEELLRVTGARHAREVWPNLGLYVWSGSPITAYEPRLRELFGPDVPFYEVYSCTEGPVAYQYEPGRPGLLLDLEHCYFEFQPVGAPWDAARLGVHEVEPHTPYRLLMTTPGGYFAYSLGDTVEFLATSPPLIRFLGREAEEINLGFEKMPLIDVRTALETVARAQDATFEEFFVAPSSDARTGYHWHVEFTRPPADLAAFLAGLDEHLKANHGIYNGQRKNDTVLGPPRLTALPPGTISRYVLETRQFGQGKFLHLYNDRQVADALMARL